ncbi:hypothetical protein RhiXN_11740 [Rhizoctonia solani]|uniref:BTB domain-containing protein n=1 Tax=Rhizoctonia solani TaxID=456999 RepID=A0A8H8P539_9AGAM|nr:uncharacterized protein RhiXN_11740 [Rhizoctonia solani]QRW24828.1 hypothetical protein RhiXN_11740 [Rhizoctonia solani]
MSARHEDSWAAHLTDLTSSTLSHPTYPQDPTYYFRDGSLLLLVEETLFKVHSSILGRESEAFNILDPIDFCNTNEGIAPVHIAGETAFEIADLKAEHFRHFLFIFYGLALLYAKRTQDEELVANVRNAIQLHFAWVSTSSPLKLINSAAGLDGSRERLIRVFKHPKLKEIDPALFGFAFCAILSLGHDIWMKDPLLSREDRVMLLSGQVHLMPLPLSTLGLGWVETLNCQNPKGWVHRLNAVLNATMSSAGRLRLVTAIANNCAPLPHCSVEFLISQFCRFKDSCFVALYMKANLQIVETLAATEC